MIKQPIRTIALVLLAFSALVIPANESAVGPEAPPDNSDQVQTPQSARQSRQLAMPMAFYSPDSGRSYVSRGPGLAVSVSADAISVVKIIEERSPGAPRNNRETLRHPPSIPQTSTREVRSTITFRGASGVKPEPAGPLESNAKILRGPHDQTVQDLFPMFESVAVRGLYAGVDLEVRFADGELQYEFVLSPGTDPTTIAVATSGPTTVTADGNLEVGLRTDAGTALHSSPVLVQSGVIPESDRLEGRWVQRAELFGFELPAYDTSRPARIDPTITMGTYLGGSLIDRMYAMATDPTGAIYLAGKTASPEFPTTPGAPDPTLATGHYCGHYAGPLPCPDAFVAKLSPDGRRLEYATFIGGMGEDGITEIDVDSAGGAIVVGYGELPLSQGAFGSETDPNFVAKLNPAGTAFEFVARFPEWISGIALGPMGEVALTGYTGGGLPVVNAWQPTFGGDEYDAFVVSLSPDATSLIFATYVGGSDSDFPAALDALDVDDSGRITAVIATESQDIATTPGVVEPIAPWDPDEETYKYHGRAGFLARFGPTGSIDYATYLPNGTDPSALAVDSGGNPYVTGSVGLASFVPSPRAFDRSCGRNGVCEPDWSSDSFVMKLSDGAQSVVYSSFFGGSGDDDGGKIALDSGGRAYITGWTTSSDLPLSRPLPTNPASGWTSYLAVVDPTGESLSASSYIPDITGWPGGGLAVKSEGVVLVGGTAYQPGLPTTPEVLDDSCGTDANCNDGDPCDQYGNTCGPLSDAYVFELNLELGTCGSRPASPVSTATFAEGATSNGFDTWYVLANPDQTRDVTACVTYVTATSKVAGPSVTVPAGGRRSIQVGDAALGYEVSGFVDGVDGVVNAERAVYSVHPGAVGSTLGRPPEAITEQVFAEGATDGGFETWILIFNPSPTETACVQVVMAGWGRRQGDWACPTYSGSPSPLSPERFLTIPPLGRSSVRMSELARTFDLSTQVKSKLAPVVAERVTYSSGSSYAGATLTGSGNGFANKWMLGEGATAAEFDTWLLISGRPQLLWDPPQVTVGQFTFYSGTSGAKITGPSFALVDGQRISVKVDEFIPDDFNVAAEITATGAGVIVERAMYSKGGRLGKTAASGEGVTAPSARWMLPEGATDGGFETWILIYNPNETITATARIDYLTSDGPVQGPAIAVGPHGRQSVRVNDSVSTFDVATLVDAGTTPIVVEHSIYPPKSMSGDATGGPGIPIQ